MVEHQQVRFKMYFPIAVQYTFRHGPTSLQHGSIVVVVVVVLAAVVVAVVRVACFCCCCREDGG